MSFDGYGDVDAHDRPIHLAEAIRRLAKRLGFSKVSLRGMIEEALGVTDNYLARVFALAELPGPPQQRLEKVVVPVRSALAQV